MPLCSIEVVLCGALRKFRLDRKRGPLDGWLRGCQGLMPGDEHTPGVAGVQDPRGNTRWNLLWETQKKYDIVLDSARSLRCGVSCHPRLKPIFVPDGLHLWGWAIIEMISCSVNPAEDFCQSTSMQRGFSFICGGHKVEKLHKRICSNTSSQS